VDNAAQLQIVAYYAERQGQRATLLKDDGSLMIIMRPGYGELRETKSQKSIISWNDTYTLGFSFNGTHMLVTDGEKSWVLDTKGKRIPVEMDTTNFPKGPSKVTGDISTDGQTVALTILGTGEKEKLFWELQVLNVADNHVILSKIFNDTSCAMLPQFTRGGKYLAVLTAGCGSFTLYHTSDWQIQGDIPATDTNGFDTTWDDSLAIILLENEAQIWDLTTMKKVRTIVDHFIISDRYGAGIRPQQEARVQFSPDNSKVAILTEPGKTIKIWNLKDLSLIRTTATQEENLNFVRLNNEGQLQFFTEAESLTGKLWNIPLDFYSDFAFSPDGSEIRFVTYDSYSLDVGKSEACSIQISGGGACVVRESRYPHNPPVSKIGTDGEFYSVRLTGRIMKVWKGLGDSGDPIGSLILDSNPYYAYFYYPLLLVPQAPVIYYKVDNARLMKNLSNKKNLNPKWLEPYGRRPIVSVLPDGSLLAALDVKSNQIVVLDLSNFESHTILPVISDNIVRIIEPTVALSSDGRRLAYVVSLWDKAEKDNASVRASFLGWELVMADAESGQPLYNAKLPLDELKDFFDLGWVTLTGDSCKPGPDKYWECSYYDPRILGNLFPADFRSDHGWLYFTSLVFSPKNDLLALSAINGTILILDSSNGEVLFTTYSESDLPTYQVVFSPDGKLLAENDGSAGIFLWGVLP
jgi:WD40 repeat protein